MRSLIFAVLVVISTGLMSCQKEDPIQPVQEEVIEAGNVDYQMSIYGEWLLVDGKMYMENLETGEKTVYNHFGPNKTTSSLRYSGAMLDFEIIEQNVTTWEFTEPPSIPSTGNFILNNDSLNPMGFHVTQNNWTIIEDPTATSASDMQLGGSSKPITAYVEDYSQETVVFYVQEAYESIDGYNYKYFSELVFQKQ